ncbi:MAG: type I 3-dehydroquinate dehydratase [bacterium]
MICVSINAENYDECNIYLTKYSFIEFRLDSTRMTLNEIKQLFNNTNKLIATCRKGKFSDIERQNILITAVKSGAMFVDMDYQTEDVDIAKIKEEAKKSFCKLILSYHNFELTPDESTLKDIINESYGKGADIVKIACKSTSDTDNLTLLSLYKHFPNGKLIAIGMNRIGKITRIAAPHLGAPFTYASAERDSETAPGQIDVKSLKKIFDLMR